MSEKVKLPKEVCKALDFVKNSVLNSNIIRRNIERTWSDKYHCLNEIDTDLLMQALVLGYESELTAEEQIKELYKHGAEGDDGIYHYDIRQKAILDTLKILGIHYDWMDDAELNTF